MSADIKKVSPPRKIQTYGDIFDAVEESIVNEVTEKVVSEIYGGIGNKLIYSTAKDFGYFKGSLEDKKSLQLNIHHIASFHNQHKEKEHKAEVNAYTEYAMLHTKINKYNRKDSGNQYLRRYLLLFLMNYAINLKQYEKYVNDLMDILKLPEDEMSLD